jgi:hypothetical protein
VNFTIDGGGALAAGQGLANMFKAYVLGDQYRQQAETSALGKAARIGQAQAAARDNLASAALKEHKLSLQTDPLTNVLIENQVPTDRKPDIQRFLETGSFGPSYATPADGVGPVMPPPVDPDKMNLIARGMAMYNKAIGTGSNVEQMAKAGSEMQTQGIRDRALAAVDNLDRMNRLNTLAKPGDTYMPFDAIGTTGYSVNKATGQGEGLDVLRKLFGEKSAADAAKDRALGGKYSAESDIERQKAERLRTTGSLPGTGAEGSEGALSPTILRTLQVPALDDKGRPARNPISGELETTTDQEALKRFYTWAAGNSRKPTATAFAQWEAAGRPGNDKNPPPAQTTPKMDAQATSAALTKAREAIAKGAARDKVIERLRQNGIDPTGL